MSDSTVILHHVIQVSEGDLGDREERGKRERALLGEYCNSLNLVRWLVS